MKSHSSATELRKMSIVDLSTELRDAKKQLAKLRLGVKLQKEKNTMKYVNEKKYVARITMVLHEKRTEELHTKQAHTKVASPKEETTPTK